MVASGNVGVAFALVFGAGAASSIGACVVFCVGLASRRIVASSLGFAAGVMLFVVFTEILMVKALGSFEDAGSSDRAAYRLSFVCFFGGIVLTALLDACVHAMMHWAARSRQQRVASNGGFCSASIPDTCTSNLSQVELMRGHPGPPPSISGEEGTPAGALIELQSAGQATGCGDAAAAEVQHHHHCSCFESLQSGREKGDVETGDECAGSSGEGETERGEEASRGPELVVCCGSAETCCRRNPDCCGRCCSGADPDCCGPTARCYNTGAGEAGHEIVPGTASAEVVAVLQSDPHTRDLLRMGIFTGLAITLHNLPEGLATFVGALNDTKVGASIAAAIAIHNIPEGICVAMPIYYATGSKWKSFMWGSLTGLAEPLGGLLGYLVLHDQDPLSFAIVFGIVSGMMVYVCVRELLPSAFRFDPKDSVVSISVLVGMAVMATSLMLFTL